MFVTTVAAMARLPILRVVLQIARDVLVDALPRSSFLHDPPPPPSPRTATRDSTLLLSLVLAHTLNTDEMPSTSLSLTVQPRLCMHRRSSDLDARADFKIH